MSRLMTARRHVWVPVAGIAGAGAGSGSNHHIRSRRETRVIDRARTDALLAPKGDFDEPKIGEHKVGENLEERIGANEVRNPDLTPRRAGLSAASLSRKKMFPPTLRLRRKTGWARTQ